MHTVYYPDGHVSRQHLRVLALYTENLLICLPGGMDPAPWMKPLLEAGLIGVLRTHRPYSPAVQTALEDYTRWAREHAGHLRHIKGQDSVLTVNPEESRAHIARTLKGLVKQESSELGAEDWRSHLLLHLAKKLDEEQNDVEELLLKAETAGKSLADIIGVEDGFKNPTMASTTPYSASGDHLMPERAAAWSYLFRDTIPEDGILVSTNVHAHEVMLDVCRELLARPEGSADAEGLEEVDPTVTTRTIALPIPETTDLEGLLAMRESWALPIRTKLNEMILAGMEDAQKKAPGDLSSMMSELSQELEGVVARESAQISSKFSGSCSMKLTLAPGLSIGDLMDALIHPESKASVHPAGGSAVILLLLEAHRGS